MRRPNHRGASLRAGKAEAGAFREARLPRAVSAWFRRSARKLPWRTKRRTAYAALVSEAMLQQTQVSRVIDAYRRFMRQFPTVKALAAADEQDVLAMWQGLGYYRRARHLHAAARMVVERFAGRIPSTVDALRRLPGVGRYTAGAIASIVHKTHDPIVDGNVQRVLMRVFANESRRWNRDGIAWAWRKADELVKHARDPGAFNEGLMELGATVCVPAPATPQCGKCPLARFCDAKWSGRQDRIPRPQRRAKPQVAHHHAVIIRNARTGKILLEQRPSRGMWSNMWQTPTIESKFKLSVDRVARLIGRRAFDLGRLGQFHHQTTHRSITFHVFAGTSNQSEGEWRDADSPGGLAISNAQKRVLKYLPNSFLHTKNRI